MNLTELSITINMFKLLLHTIKTDKIEKDNRDYDKILPRDIYEKYKHLDQVWEKTPNFNFINKIHFTSK